MEYYQHELVEDKYNGRKYICQSGIQNEDLSEYLLQYYYGKNTNLPKFVKTGKRIKCDDGRCFLYFIVYMKTDEEFPIWEMN